MVNVSSAAARDPFPGFAAYGAAKAGLNLFGLSAAREGEPIGVRVHTVAPFGGRNRDVSGPFDPGAVPAAEKTLDPADLGRMIASVRDRRVAYTSGETIYVHKTV